MPDGGTIVGGITKLTIEAFEDVDCTKPTEESIVVPINPEGYSQKLGAKYTESEAIGASGRQKVLYRELGESLTLKLILDGTGAVPFATTRSVTDQILDLRRIGLRINKDTDETNYLKLSWGVLLFKCRMTRLQIQYTLFNPDGTPLRASVQATFDSVRPPNAPAGKESARKKGRYETVRAGDTLPTMCQRVYGNPNYYPDVAFANQLDTFAVSAGRQLYFPPLGGSAT
jgi:hypothetical protein